MQKTLEQRIDRIEKVFWAAGVIAVIFGLSGAWGYKAITKAKTEIDTVKGDITTLKEDIVPLRQFVDKADVFVENAKKDLEKKKNESISEIARNTDDLAVSAIQKNLKNRLVASKEGGHIKSLGKHNLIKMKVSEGDVLQATYTGSAIESQFYYHIVENTGIAKPTAGSIQVIQVPAGAWRSIAVTESFVAKKSGQIQLAVEFFKSDVSGAVHVFGSTLIATKVGSM